MATEVLPEDEMLREATVEDYQAVLDIEPNGYLGYDYLPATFSSLVEGQGVRGYVYEKENKVVGFLSTKVVDSGQTVMESAGRVHPDYRGVGMYGRFKRAVLEKFASSNVQNVVFAVCNENMNTFSHLSRKYNLIMEKALTNVEVEVDIIGEQLSRVPVPSTDDLQPLTLHHLHSMLSQPPSHLPHLFPQQRILLNWQPFKIMPDNADVIANSCRDHVFVASARDLASIDKGNNFPVSLLSYGSHYSCQRGRTYDIDVFGSGSVMEMVKHLVWHFRRITEVAKERKAIIRIFANERVDEAVAILQTQLSVHPLALPFHIVYVLEGRLNQ